MPTAEPIYPSPAFYFRVEIEGASEDSSFQEVRGITSEIETEAYVEGGENGFVHQLPKGVKHPNLVLKRGIGAQDSALVTWCRKTLEGGGVGAGITPRALQVKLLNEKGDPLHAWSFSGAYPVKWSVDAFHSTKNQVAIETIELSYTNSDKVV